MGLNNTYTPPNTRKAAVQILAEFAIEMAAKNYANAKAARLSVPGYEFHCNEQDKYIDSRRQLSDIEVIGIRLGYVDAGNLKGFSFTRRPKKIGR